jgi:chromosome segregation ATPase
MKKTGVVIIVVILAIEVVLLVHILRSRTENQGIGEAGTVGKEDLSPVPQENEITKKEWDALKASVNELTIALNAKEQEIQEAAKAKEILQTGVTAKFEEYQKKAALSDEQRKVEIAELNKKIEIINGEKAALAAKYDEELKKRDAAIAQLTKDAELTEKILGEERQQTAELTKQLNEEKGKVKTLTEQITAANAEKDKMKGELDAEKKKSADLAAENDALKKKN